MFRLGASLLLLSMYRVPAQTLHMLDTHSMFVFNSHEFEPCHIIAFLLFFHFSPVFVRDSTFFCFLPLRLHVTLFFMFVLRLFLCSLCTGYLPKVNILLCMVILLWALLAVCRSVLVHRCCNILLLNLNPHEICAVCGVAAAGSSVAL